VKNQSQRRSPASIALRQASAIQIESLDQVFGALADPIRRAILTRLADGECAVSTLGEPFAVSPPAISKHLRVLEKTGLIARRKSGRVHYCRLRTDPLRRGSDWIQQLTAFWERQFDSLAKYLEQEQS
jgi:DNA-binding transcriptional ArsR family regulator